MAELLTRSLPSIEQVRLVSSGTEAVMSALRLARGFTGRSLIVKFEGCYHGHSDFLLVKAGSGALTFGNPTSAGVPPELTSHTLVLDYNDAQQLEDAFARFGPQIAAVVLEPVAGNMNFVRPSQAFHETLRRLCTQHGAVLIFDEVMTGFRVGPQGAQGVFGITPGPHDARQGDRRRDARGRLRRAPRHHGEARAGRARLPGRHALRKPGRGERGPRDPEAGAAPPDSSRRCRPPRPALTEGLAREASDGGRALQRRQPGRDVRHLLPVAAPASFAQVMECDKERFNRFFHAMLRRGVYLAPSAFEAGFVSAAHGPAEIEFTLAAAREAFGEARAG